MRKIRGEKFLLQFTHETLFSMTAWYGWEEREYFSINQTFAHKNNEA